MDTRTFEVREKGLMSFGDQLAMHENALLVGGVTELNGERASVFYLFEASTGEIEFTIDLSDYGYLGSKAHKANMSAEHIAITVDNTNGKNMICPREVLIFSRADGKFIRSIGNPYQVKESNFGVCLEVQNDWLITSSRRDLNSLSPEERDYEIGSDNHDVFVFVISSGELVSTIECPLSMGEYMDFGGGGSSICASEHYISVGTWKNLSNPEVILYEMGTWRRHGTLSAPLGADHRYFGAKLACEGKFVLVSDRGWAVERGEWSLFHLFDAQDVSSVQTAVADLELIANQSHPFEGIKAMEMNDTYAIIQFWETVRDVVFALYDFESSRIVGIDSIAELVRDQKEGVPMALAGDCFAFGVRRDGEVGKVYVVELR